MYKIVFSAIMSCLLLMTEGRYFVPDIEDITQENADYDGRDDTFCPVLLTKPLTALLISEYNRISSTNQRYYMQLNEQTVQCKPGDYSSCHVTVDLTASTCDRSEASEGCQPSSHKILKKCRGSVDLIQAEITEPLKCWSLSDILSQVPQSKIKMMAENSALKESSLSSPQADMPISLFRKKWGEDDGNVYPF